MSEDLKKTTGRKPSLSRSDGGRTFSYAVRVGRPRIPVDAAEIARLHDQGLSWRRIAKGLGLSPATVRARYEELLASQPAPVPDPIQAPAHSEPPKQTPKPAPAPEELGVFGLDTIPSGAEVVWLTSSETIAEQARKNYAHPIVVIEEWYRSLGDHPVFRDAKLLWHIRPEWSRYDDPEMEADRRLQASLEADPQIKSRLQWARNPLPQESLKRTVTPPPPRPPWTGSHEEWRIGGSGATASVRNPSGAIDIPSEDPDSPEAIRKWAGGLLGT